MPEPPYRRVIVLVIDSVGAGALPDAVRFGDEGTSTLGHTAASVGGLALPHLQSLGLGNIIEIAGVDPAPRPRAAWGRLAERSAGKDTTTGHWELMGLVLTAPFPLFPDGFPEDVIRAFAAEAGVDGVLGNRPASGTVIIEELGPEHERTGRPIVYTSGDSVFQVAAHTRVIPLERLYTMCRAARRLLDPIGVGRVIARPFEGEPGRYRRTYDRRDYSLAPPEDTVLDRVKAAGLPVVGVGKIHDIFAGRGLTDSRPTRGNLDGMRVTGEVLDTVTEGFVLVNLIDFDSSYGHRRDPEGYARCLEEFDAALPPLLDRGRTGDLLIITADHGNDPTHAASTDHTREFVPVLVLDPSDPRGVDLGIRDTFADVGATVCAALGVPAPAHGVSLLDGILEKRESL
jgi:phosphopentomutase